ncbi:hypothetical protein K4F52_007193 [Lecanicillium sp. MT-2017a]|nr:hypothetical protein K4F52_007193 [Lecanicillium sp. MT-2017a]
MISLAETLLNNGASWDDVTPEGDSLLSYLILSSQPRSPEGLKYYLEHVPRSSRTAVLAATHGQGQTPLHHAAAVPKLDKSIMMMLLGDGTYGLRDVILGKDDKGRTALHIASMCGNSTAVRLLLEAGTAVDVCDDGGDTPLALALKRPDSVERWNLVNSFNGNGADRTALQHFDSETNTVVALLQAYIAL